ncbi:hypothetical protein [Flavivirga eckloniae]|uniref:Uncharacterized protein n=1 Tax=Flavivirga eckloniae TaxID=1803846 RepID=A0A2K9PNG0_9FLAO|nr:hypothetical protein [Flavivirga eckloniae]AUP78603.1 hypothetical protein C1H87_07710 [Flavivirga eckloniae]
MKSTTATKTEQKINLIDGYFTISEAADIINSILTVKINFHKLQRLSKTEGNEKNKCEYDNSRIDELINEQQTAKAFFKNVGNLGKKLKINSTIHMTLEN